MTVLEFFSVSIMDLIWCVVIIILTVIFLRVVRHLKNTLISKMGDHSDKSVIKRINVVNIFYKITKYMAIMICVLTAMQICGVNVTSILTGLGIAGVLAGIAVQDLFKDLIQGMRIVTDDFFGVGDYIDYKGELFRVVGLSGRTTTLKSVAMEDIVNICNRNIVEVRRLSGKVSINIPVPYSVDTTRLDTVFNKSVEEISEIAGVSECKYLGLKAYENEKAVYLLVFRCNPGEILIKRRAAQRIILDNIYAAGLEMAVTQIDIING